MTTVPRWTKVAGAASVALVAAIAAIVSYSHMYTLAHRAGEGWRAWLEPLSVDGLLVGSSLILYVRGRSSWLTWVSVFLGIAVSLAANLAAAEPGLIPRLVAAWPAVALALSYETLLTLVRSEPDRSTGVPVPVWTGARPVRTGAVPVGHGTPELADIGSATGAPQGGQSSPGTGADQTGNEPNEPERAAIDPPVQAVHEGVDDPGSPAHFAHSRSSDSSFAGMSELISERESHSGTHSVKTAEPTGAEPVRASPTEEPDRSGVDPTDTAERSDDELMVELRALVEEHGGTPSLTAVRTGLRVGTGRARRLLGRLGGDLAASQTSGP